MGNCLVIQDSRKEIKIMSVDGTKVIQMPSPSSFKIQESLAKSSPPGHGISGLFPVNKVPAPAPAIADPGAVRVKLVVSKQELKKMLDKEGMSLDDMVSLMRKEASYCETEQECCGGWRPVLESVPEGSDL